MFTVPRTVLRSPYGLILSVLIRTALRRVLIILNVLRLLFFFGASLGTL